MAKNTESLRVTEWKRTDRACSFSEVLIYKVSKTLLQPWRPKSGARAFRKDLVRTLKAKPLALHSGRATHKALRPVSTPGQAAFALRLSKPIFQLSPSF